MQLIASKLDSISEIEQLRDEWEELLPLSTQPSIYATFDYLALSIKHFCDGNDKVFFLILRERQVGTLIAIFPLSIRERSCYAKKVRVLQHAITTYDSDVDKPYPIIHYKYENQSWLLFKKYIDNELDGWDWLEYVELIQVSAFNHDFKRLFRLPKYYSRQSHGPKSPIVDLSKSWDSFQVKHRNMRKKLKRVTRLLGDRYRYQVYHEEADMKYALRCYIDTEKESWKRDNGVSAVQNQVFYYDLLPRMALENKAYIGILFDDKIPISVEIAYVYQNKVYMALGTYRTNYSALSPGTVSTSLFLKFFFDKGYSSADFLAGFADYINPLADRVEPTMNTVVFKVNGLFFYYVFRRLVLKCPYRLKVLIKRMLRK